MKMIVSEFPNTLLKVVVCAFFLLVLAQRTYAQIVHIPDANFKNYLITRFDENGDGEIQTTEAERVSDVIDITQMGISDLTGLEAFINISILRAALNLITSVDLSANQKLTGIVLSYNRITSIDLRRNAALKGIYLSDNQLTSFDASGNPKLEHLDLARNQLDHISLDRNTALKRLELYDNAIESIDLSNQSLLQSLNIFENELTALNTENNSLLEVLNVSRNPLEGTLDLSRNQLLTNIKVSGTHLSQLNMANGSNHLMSSDDFEATNNDSLTCIQVDDVSYAEATFTEVDAHASFSLQCVDDTNTHRSIYECVDVATIIRTRLSSVDLVGGSNGDFSEGSVILYKTASANYGKLLVTGFSRFGLQFLEFEWVTYSADGAVVSTGRLATDSSTDLDQGVAPSSIFNADFIWSNATLKPQGRARFKVYDGLVRFNDTNFKSALVNHSPIIDANGDREIQICEARSFDGMLDVYEKGISDLSGIEAFTNAYGINAGNNALRKVDLDNNVEIMFLDLRNNQIQQLDIEKNVKLTTLEVGNNRLSELDVSKNHDLLSLSCYGNHLTELYLKENPGLAYLDAGGNAIESLNLRENQKLRHLVVPNNKLTALKVTNNTKLVAINALENQITFLDLSNNPFLHTLTVSDNELTTLDLGSNVNLQWFRAERNKLSSILFNESSPLQLVEVAKNQLTFLKLRDFPLLHKLSASSNQLEWIDITGSTELQHLDLSHNSLEGHLDLSSFSRLRVIWLDHNLLSSLSIANGSNHFISNSNHLNLINNPNLRCVEVDDVDYANWAFTSRDAHTVYSEDCAGSRIANEQITDVGVLDEVSVYPNPTTGYFTVSTQVQGILVIYNSAGAKVKEVMLDGEAKVNLSDQEAGLFILSISDTQGQQIHTSKMIKTQQ